MSFLYVYFQSMKLRLVFHKSSINKTKKTECVTRLCFSTIYLIMTNDQSTYSKQKVDPSNTP